MDDEAVIKFKLKTALQVLNLYKSLIDSYVLDFFVCDHWNTLPNSFKSLENDISYEHLVRLLLEKQSVEQTRVKILPLSLLAIKKLNEIVCITRNSSVIDAKRDEINEKSVESKLDSVLKKRVKPKKLHEIQKILKICDRTIKLSNVRTIIDFGSGLGHLSRHLQYKLGIDIICIEQNLALVNEAIAIDTIMAQKYLKFTKNLETKTVPGNIFHIPKCLKTEKDFQSVLASIQNNFNQIENSNIGLIGLHPCGDLAVLLLKSFLNSPEVKFILIVGCCYMKLTTESTFSMEGRPTYTKTPEFSYPLSNFLKKLTQNQYNLSYEALESATHAIEKYLNEIQLVKKETEFYKINCYRATIEAIIVKYYPDKKHCGLRNVRYSEGLTFAEYAKKAINGLGIELPEEEFNWQETKMRLKQWKRVVIYYLLRLIFSPFIESVLLYDRQLFLIENGCKCNVEAIFDPLISPRCHVMSAIKINDEKS
uniref:CSON009167 protein n=1 Tax=Culicoides sonorensis TaxID=179676 RepID=A0A336LK04_CULSO